METNSKALLADLMAAKPNPELLAKQRRLLKAINSDSNSKLPADSNGSPTPAGTPAPQPASSVPNKP